MAGITGSNGAGAGFFVDVADGRPGAGYILTSYSLVAGSCQVNVQLPTDGTQTRGRVYAKDAKLDLALIEIDGRIPPTAVWGGGKDIKVGDRVFAFGFGTTQRNADNLIEGVVQDLPAGASPGDADARETPLEVSWDDSGVDTGLAFQGGPLLNLDGEVLGIYAAHPGSLDGPPDEEAAATLSPLLIAQESLGAIPRLGSGEPILTTSPDFPTAGRQVSFTLETQPHQVVRITILEPDGQEAAWIYPEGATRATDGQLVTTRTLGADPCGKVEWVRPGFRDIPGVWTARVIVGPYQDQPQAASLTYTLTDLEIEDQGTIHMGIDLRTYQGPESQVFFSDLVPAALAVDLQSRLASIVEGLENRLGFRTAEIPDLYLTANHSLFKRVQLFMGLDLGFAGAYFAYPCARCPRHDSGIYLWVNVHDFETTLLQTLTHEYAHALVDVIANGKAAVLPQWVNEGFSVWSENGITMAGSPSGSDKAESQQWFLDADTVRLAALSSNLLTLASMESSHTWQGRTGDQVALQYAESFMAVRYLTETYGESAIVDLISDFSRQGDLSMALKGPTGIGYREFETGFNAWLTREKPTDAYYQRGVDHYSAGEYQKAIDELSVLIEIESVNDDAYNWRGLAHYRLMEYQESIADFDESIRLEPRAGRFQNRGASYSRLGQHQRAIEDFDQAIRFDGGYYSAYSWRGSAYYELEQYQRAIDSFEMAALLGPSAIRLTNLGSAYYQVERYQRSVEDLTKAIRLDPSYARAYSWRADAYSRLGQLDLNRADLATACSLNSQYC